jgi:hypothetical protein
LPLGVLRPNYVDSGRAIVLLNSGANQQAVRGKQLVDVAGYLHLAIVDYHEVVANAFKVSDEMRRHQNGYTVFGNCRSEALQELASGQWVQPRHRLIQQEKLGAFAERKGESDLRSLSAGEVADFSVERDIQAPQASFGGPLIPAPVQLAAEAKHVSDGKTRIQRSVLSHEPDPIEQQERLLLR